MKRKLTVLSVVVAVLVLIAALTACNGKEDTDLEILPAKTIHITTAAELTDIKNYLGKAYQNYDFVLDNDIDLSTIESWTPIGDSAENAFCGIFDGNGKTISNLQCKGWNSDYTPIAENLDSGANLENVASFPTMALFGYVDSATLKNININGINFEYYAEAGSSYIAGVAAYSLGASRFENISADGKISVDNLYKKSNTYDTRGERQGVVYSCDVTLYAGGINAYNSGTAVFENVRSSIDFDNEFPRAYLHNESNAEPEEIEAGIVEEKYISGAGTSDSHAAPYRVFIGGICGVTKSGKIIGSSYGGKINIYGKSVYAGGIVAAGYGGSSENNAVSGTEIKVGVHTKSAVGGIVALADDFDLSQDEVNNLKVNSTHYALAQAMNIGGAFALACNTASVKGVNVENFGVSVNLATASVGGVGGVLRDATLSSSTCATADFKISVSGLNKDKCDAVFAGIVNAVYNNSVVESDNTFSSVTANLNRESWNIDKVYCVKNSTTYVDEDGKEGIRLFQKGRTDKYIHAFAVKEGEGLRVKIYNEELSLLSEALYERSEGFENTENMAETYLSVYFEDGTGFKVASSGTLTAEGRDLTAYEYRSGKPVVPQNN